MLARSLLLQGPDEALLARTLFRWSGGAAPLPLPVLDTHVHFYDVERPGGVPWPPPENKLLYRTVQPEHLTELASSWGLAGCIAVECSPIVADNAQLLKLAAGSSVVRGVVGGGIEIGSKTFAEDVDKFAKHPKFVGIRARALPFLESIESLEASKESYFGDLEHLAVHELSLDLIGPATVSSPANRLLLSVRPQLRRQPASAHHNSHRRFEPTNQSICCCLHLRIQARSWAIAGGSLPNHCECLLKWRNDTLRYT